MDLTKTTVAAEMGLRHSPSSRGYPQGKGKGCVIAEDEALAYPEEESHDDDNSQDTYEKTS